MSVTIGLTEIMPLSLLLPNGATNRFVQARLYNDATGTEIAGSPATLTHLSSGRYTNYSKAAPSAKTRVRAFYTVFDDAGLTAPSADFEVSEEIINVDDGYAMTKAVYQLEGLDPSAPMTVTPVSRVAGAITQTISGDGVASSTVTRV